MKNLLINLIRKRRLLIQFTIREIQNRYKGSYLGIAWTLIHPLVMLAIYSFVFSVVFKVRWGNSEGIKNLDFAMLIFCGLIIFQIFSESMYRSSSILFNNSNFVKRVVFPLEILPTSAVLGICILNLFSIIVLIFALIWFDYPVGWHLLLIPFILLPVILFTLGMSYIIATIGVFFRDLGHLIGILMNMLFYISPIFYPIGAVPERFQIYMLLNPFTVFVESFRSVTIYNQSPSWGQFFIVSAISIVVFVIGSFIFDRSKESFSDVV